MEGLQERVAMTHAPSVAGHASNPTPRQQPDGQFASTLHHATERRGIERESLS